MRFAEKAKGFVKTINSTETDNDLIDATLNGINRGYKAGLIDLLQKSPEGWDRMLTIERKINQAALEKDRGGLIEFLQDYTNFFHEKGGKAMGTPEQHDNKIQGRGGVIKDMRHHDRFPPQYLKKEDFPVPQILTILSLQEEDIKTDKGSVKKWVLYFDEFEDRGLVMNSSNSQKLEQLYGDDSNWPGKKIEVFNDENVMYAGKVTGGLRLRRPPQPESQLEMPM